MKIFKPSSTDLIEEEIIEMSVSSVEQDISVDIGVVKPINLELMETDSDMEIELKDYIVATGGGGGVMIYPAFEDFPAIGNETYLYIAKEYGTFYWDKTLSAYKPIPLYEEIIEKIWITADNYQILTADNKIFKPIM